MLTYLQTKKTNFDAKLSQIKNGLISIKTKLVNTGKRFNEHIISCQEKIHYYFVFLLFMYYFKNGNYQNYLIF